MKPLKRIGLVAFDRRKAVGATLNALVRDPVFAGLRFFSVRGLLPSGLKGVAALPAARFGRSVDVAVSFGGDGSFISAARLVTAARTPLVGVNMGTLGFLTDVPAQEARPILARIFSGHCRVERRMMFDVSLLRKGRAVFSDLCLNDAVVRADRLFHLAAFQGPRLISFFNADGLVVSTPTGSTAYSMAAGGPIVQPTLQCAVVTPLCSHSLTQKPIVSAVNEPLVLRLEDRRVPVSLVVDGKARVRVLPGDDIVVRRSASVTTLLRPEGVDFYGALRNKLCWGRPG